MTIQIDEYGIGIMREPVDRLLCEERAPPIAWLPKPKGARFCADPFGVWQGDDLYIFFELLWYGRAHGEIACVRVRPDNSMSAPEVVLRVPHHLSYPYLFEFEGAVYCIPETHQAHEVALYHLAAFPGGWRKLAVLLPEVDIVDASIVRHRGRWWLFGGSVDCRALYLWHASSPFGPWRAHRHAPVKVDVRSARPAGALFVHDGALYRPAQDCFPIYGARTVVHRVTALSPDEFREAPVAIIEPERAGPYPRGLHTVSAAGRCTLVDGCRRVYSAHPYELYQKARVWLRSRQGA
jgi:hypothetical protein